MTSPQEFNCVFCKESFTNKEELQIHFRKHGDPKFNPSAKTKSKSQNESSDDKRNEDAEMVSCDVCTETFPTISKAITHKHKVHPDHDAKYFCPWCGKLFTMKHLYNKHLQSNHNELETRDNVNFHCDMCNVDFYVASAMLYHNKFFHRQDTDLSTVGQSKKLRMVNQDVLQIYYCAFCGDEYDNKVNLHKHMLDDHSDENQSPVDVLRCPLCEAIFYHLDAYEVHLTFHSTDDLYTEKNELFEQITEFSLETVPPLMEKVENMESQDVESSINAIGLDQFLELAMDGSIDSKDSENPKKSKKHKKHKKSKKAAITLDEFLNMNQDVFGEGLDVQGVEEVPTKVVAKKLKQTKKPVKPNLKSLKGTDLEKLKKQGIIVKMKQNNRQLKGVQVGCKLPNKNTRVSQQSISNKTTSQTDTTDEVLSKLLNRGDSQIKIVKKTSNENAGKPSSTEITKSCTTPESTEVQCDVHSRYISPETEANEECKGQDTCQNIENQISKEAALDPDEKSYTEDTENTDHGSLCHEENGDDAGKEAELNIIKTKPTIVSNNLIKKPFPPVSKNERVDTNSPLKPKDELSSKSPSPLNDNTKKSSLDALKHLSHLITVKSVNKVDSTNAQETQNRSEEYNEDEDGDHDECDDDFDSASEENESAQTTKDTRDTSKSLEALKSLNKNITVKSLIQSPNCGNLEKSNAANIIKSSEAEQNAPLKTLTSTLTVGSQPSKLSPMLKQDDVKDQNIGVSNKLEKQNVNTNLLKHLTNITAKPISKTAQGNVFDKSSNNLKVADKKEVTQDEIIKKEINEDIEIFNIDDSDSDEAGKTNKSIQETKASKTVSNEYTSHKSLDKLKNVQNITVKSLNQKKTIVNKSVVKRIPHLKETLQSNDPCSMSDFSDEDDHDMLMPANLSINQKLSLQGSNINALKNLGKHITIKSRNFPSVTTNCKKNLNLSQDPRDNMDDADSDNDLLPGKVTISELKDENFSEDDAGDDKGDNREYDAYASVQTPEASNSDQENGFNEDEDDEVDFENQIKANTVKRHLEAGHSRASNIKILNKNITIKSVSKDNKEGQPASPKINPSVPMSGNKELSIKPFKQVRTEVDSDCSHGKVSNVTKAMRTMNQSVDQNLASNNCVNKEVTVKTFQNKTVIEEITTTVTKTIKTVNQTVQQQYQSSSQSIQPMKFQKVKGMKTNQNIKNFQGVAVRQAGAIAGTKVRGLTPNRPSTGMNVRPSNQLVPVRPSNQLVPVRASNQLVPVRASNQLVPVKPSLNSPTATTPRMPVVRKNPTPSSNQSNTNIGKSIKVSPNVVTTSKRPSEDNVGHFSCFKKPKESLIPVSDVPNFDNEQMNSTVHYASHSKSNFSSATKTVRGNTVVTSTQMRSETSNSSQHLSKLNNLSGLKVVKTSQKQVMQVEEKNELSASQRNTLEAIEKLKKQGLLIKKPRMDVHDDSDLSGEENEYLTEEPED